MAAFLNIKKSADLGMLAYNMLVKEGSTTLISRLHRFHTQYQYCIYGCESAQTLWQLSIEYMN